MTKNMKATSVVNKKAEWNYQVVDRIEAGMVLSGEEVKAVRAHGVDFAGAYVKFSGGEAYLINAHIGVREGDSRRTRKLLLKREEIVSVGARLKQKKLTLVPLRMYNTGRLIKLEVGLARTSRKDEKRAQLKARDISRDVERELREV